MNYKKYTLKNGLRIILAPMQDNQTATVLVMTGIGSRFESRRENGLAHFLEHMFFKGTPRRPTTQDIAIELDSVGSSYNAFTSKEYTGYYAKVEAHHWEHALDIVSDLFLNATLEAAEIERERGAITQEINMFEDSPMRYVGEVFERLMYHGHEHPLGFDIAGPKENIQTFKRPDFIRFLNRGYVASNVVIGVAGKIEPAKVKRAIEKHFAKIRTGKKPIYKKFTGKQTVPGILVKKKKTDQTHVLVGVRAYDMHHKDRYVLGLLATILGGGMSSRLFLSIRERRGLAYHVSTMAEAYQDAGYLATQANVGNENLYEATKIILEEYKKIATEKVEEKELQKAKDYLKGHLALGLEGSDDVVEDLVTQELLRGEIRLPKERMKKIDAVTTGDILRVARDIFRNQGLNLAAIGPNIDEKKLKKLLKF